MAGLASGKIDLVIGFTPADRHGVSFKKLGLAIIDEQRRRTQETLKKPCHRRGRSIVATPSTHLEIAFSGIREMSILQTPPERAWPV